MQKVMHRAKNSSKPIKLCHFTGRDAYHVIIYLTEYLTQLPPKEKLNGVVRKAKIKYWMKKEKRVILKYSHNVTEGKITKIQENADYFVQVAICTAGQLCSNYTEAASIPKNSNEVIHGRGNNNISMWFHLILS